MLKKLRLDQTKEYEKHLALEEIATMLETFVNGRPHYLSIGAEQGDIEGWDDFIIEKNNGGYIYIQAKRQATDFSEDPIVRDNIKQGKNKGKSRKLSPFDKAMEVLGKKIYSVDKRSEFWIALPEGNIEIKRNLSVRDFIKLREDYIKDITTQKDLIELSQKEKSVKSIYDWLTTWCDFSDWSHILNALKVLRIIKTGLESDITSRVVEKLNRVFLNSEVEKVRMLILQYLDDNSTPAGAIRPRQLLYTLKDYLLPSVARWTQFQLDNMQWNISGIHDLEGNDEIERPEIIVPAFWNKDNPNPRHLYICGSCLEGCKISIGLMRLLIHPFGSFDIYCSEKFSWQSSIKSKTGGTLGVSKSDIDCLRIIDGREPYQSTECKSLMTTDAKEKFADSLQSEMYKITFKHINIKLIEMINGMERCELRTEVESRWIDWKQLLENDIEEQRRLFSKILHPKAEGESISGELRVGPKTVTLLSEAIFHLLIVSICLGDDDNKKWSSVENGIKVYSIGLEYWSGPADKPKKVIKIDDDTGINELLKNETEQIIILPQSNLPESEFFQDDIAGEKNKLGLLTYPKYPQLLITNNNAYRKKLRNGVISKLREYFDSNLKNYKNIIENSVNHVVGVMKE